MFQTFFSKLCLKERLRRFFAHLKVTPIYGHHLMVLLLVAHLLLDYRELRDSRYYQEDEMAATLSRALTSADETSVTKGRDTTDGVISPELIGACPGDIGL